MIEKPRPQHEFEESRRKLLERLRGLSRKERLRALQGSFQAAEGSETSGFAKLLRSAKEQRKPALTKRR